MHMDIFNEDAFSLVNMTAAIEKMPTVPTFLGSLGIFGDGEGQGPSVSPNRHRHAPFVGVLDGVADEVGEHAPEGAPASSAPTSIVRSSISRIRIGLR